MKNIWYILFISLNCLAQSQWKCRLPLKGEGKQLVFYKIDAPAAAVSCTGAPAQPAAINGPTMQCSTQPPFNYSILPVTGATAYVWTLPGGWFGNSTTTSISCVPGVSGNISVVATNSCGNSPAQTLSVTVLAGPAVTITPFTSSLCAGGSLTLTANGANNYTWSTGSNSTTVALSPSVTTVYQLTATAVNTCVAVLNRTISVYAIPNITATAVSSMICAGEVATLTASGAANYNWNPSATGATVFVTPNVTTTYTITGTTQFGCQNTQTVTQNVSPCTAISENIAGDIRLFAVPNPFSDRLKIFLTGITKATELSVFNLAGQKIYSAMIGAHEDPQGFDMDPGIFTGKGIYFLILEGESFRRTAKVVKE